MMELGFDAKSRKHCLWETLYINDLHTRDQLSRDQLLMKSTAIRSTLIKTTLTKSNHKTCRIHCIHVHVGYAKSTVSVV